MFNQVRKTWPVVNNFSYFHTKFRLFFNHVYKTAATPFRMPLACILRDDLSLVVWLTSVRGFAPKPPLFIPLRFLTLWHLYRCFTFVTFIEAYFILYCSDRALGFTGFRCVIYAHFCTYRYKNCLPDIDSRYLSFSAIAEPSEFSEYSFTFWSMSPLVRIEEAIAERFFIYVKYDSQHHTVFFCKKRTSVFPQRSDHVLNPYRIHTFSITISL